MAYFIINAVGMQNIYMKSNLTGEDTKKDAINREYKFETAKKILFFTSYFGMHDWMFGFGNKPFIDHKCPITNCYITNNRHSLNMCKYKFELIKLLCIFYLKTLIGWSVIVSVRFDMKLFHYSNKRVRCCPVSHQGHGRWTYYVTQPTQKKTKSTIRYVSHGKSQK